MKKFIILIVMLLILGFTTSTFAMGKRSMCSHHSTKNTIIKEMKNAFTNLYGEEVANMYRIKITKIRTTFNNSITKAASCVAIMEISIDGQITPVNIAYNVMPLDESPGEFYVEILMAE